MKKHIVIVGGGLLTLPAYKVAQEELGLAVIGVDLDANSPGMRRADVSLCLSTKDVDAVVAAVQDLSKSIPICGVFTCGADVEVTVAAIAACLGLPSVSLEVAYRCNNKILMHRYLDSAGFMAKARYLLCHKEVDAQQAAKDFGFPCVVKPLDNCASRGVQIIAREDQMLEAFSLAASFNLRSDDCVIVEECLLGSKHTIEMIAYRGEWHLLSIVDTHYISLQWPCESLLHTTALPPEMQMRLFDFAVSAAKAIGIDFGAHKVDINLTPQGEIKLIELTARLSGGFHCQYASPIAYGSEDIKGAMRIAIGQPLSRSDIRRRWNRAAAVMSIFPGTGTIGAIEGIEDALASVGVRELFFIKGIGEEVGPFQNSGDRFCFLITEGDSPLVAVDRAKAASMKLRVTVK